MRATIDAESEVAPAAARYLADIFMQVGGTDRELVRMSDRIGQLLERRSRPLTAPEARELGDLFEGHRSETQALMARVTPAALQRAQELARVTPSYTRAIIDLAGEEIDEYVRPIFEESGVAHRFITIAEALATT